MDDEQDNELDAQVLITIRVNSMNHNGSKKRAKQHNNPAKVVIMIPIDGMSMRALATCVNNYDDPWSGLLDDEDIEFLRPMTLPSLIRSTGTLNSNDWYDEAGQVSRILHDDRNTVENCVLMVSRESDYEAWTLPLPLQDLSEARALTGI